MKFLSVLLVAGVILGSSPVEARRPIFACPDEIHPCTCVSRPRKIVRCNDVSGFGVVRRALEGKFETPIPNLEISNIHTFKLPHNALSGLSIKTLILNGSDFLQVNDHAFDGIDSLGALKLSEDILTDFPTAALRNLSSLRSLSLSGNVIVKITDQSIKGLPRLQILILSDNKISEIERNSFPPYLKSLSLSKNSLSTLNGSISRLNQLEFFFAAHNQLGYLGDEFAGLSKLEHLGLDSNGIEDINGSFDDLTSLRTLNLAHNELERVEAGLYPLKRLQNLNLSYNYINELDEDLFRSVNGIQLLDLSGNYLKNVCQALRPLQALRVLRLSAMFLTKLDQDCFKGMKSLQTLDLSQNELTNIDVLTEHSFPRLLVLQIQNNALQSFRHGFKNLKNLYELDITGNHFSSIESDHFVHNAQLSTIKMGDNQWNCSDNNLLGTLEDLRSRMVNIIDAPLCQLESMPGRITNEIGAIRIL